MCYLSCFSFIYFFTIKPFGYFFFSFLSIIKDFWHSFPFHSYVFHHHMGNSLNYWTIPETLFLLYLKFSQYLVVNSKWSPTHQKIFGPKCFLIGESEPYKNIYMGPHTFFFRLGQKTIAFYIFFSWII